jgi:CRISPR-associated protein Csm2
MWHEKVAFEQSADKRLAKYKELAPYVKMMKAKVAYARGRDHVDECFEKLFAHVIGQINSPETLRHAKLFMEAFMGFYKAEEKQ